MFCLAPDFHDFSILVRVIYLCGTFLAWTNRFQSQSTSTRLCNKHALSLDLSW